ncbi:MAG TPA: DUF4911 domain-containing protein [Desulfomicrobiaceae bacterium]|nr:DUF4911 domain-containing protein [Desulfomicrobiaceae bacterium]
MARSCEKYPSRPRTWSARIYARVPRERIALIKFLFEGYDNLAYVSVIDRFQAVIRISCSPDGFSETLQVCATMEQYGLEVVSSLTREGRHRANHVEGG